MVQLHGLGDIFMELPHTIHNLYVLSYYKIIVYHLNWIEINTNYHHSPKNIYYSKPWLISIRDIYQRWVVSPILEVHAR